MTPVDARRPLREAYHGLSHRCLLAFPCVSDPARRSSLCLKFTLVLLHVVVVGVLFLFDRALAEKTRVEPWYTVLYLGLFVATLIQYFITSGSSPGYVEDVMRAWNETSIGSLVPWRKLSASKENESLLPTTDRSQLGKNNSRMNSASWLKLVMDLYLPGSSSRNWTCSYCNIVQPPRAKHCHDCEKCVLQFDHHCVWLGTCIGQGNHCRFWWYILEETALCMWTIILYLSYLQELNARLTWWKEAIAIIFVIVLTLSLVFLVMLLIFHSYLILTNQTTYELVRRRRISYLRGIPARVHPFSKGICRNVYSFCCSYSNSYILEAVPTTVELEAKAKPYTCLDVICCRCC